VLFTITLDVQQNEVSVLYKISHWAAAFGVTKLNSKFDLYLIALCHTVNSDLDVQQTGYSLMKNNSLIGSALGLLKFIKITMYLVTLFCAP